MKKLVAFLMAGFFAISLSGQTLLDTALNFTAKDVHGNNIELFNILDDGNIVVIDFFSTA